MQHRTVLIVFPPNLQTVIVALMLENNYYNGGHGIRGDWPFQSDTFHILRVLILGKN